MKTEQIFSFRRLYLLLRRQILSNSRNWLIAFGGMAGMLLVISVMIAYFNPVGLVALLPLYFTGLFVGGYIFTSNVFGEMQQPQRSHQYLTLPVSSTERLVAAWILSAIVFPFLAWVAMEVIGWMGNVIMQIIADQSPFKTTVTSGSWTAIKVYMVTQSVFLLGAAYFRKHNFIKTILALFVFSVIVQAVMGLSAWLIFNPFDQTGGVTLGPGDVPHMETFFMETVPRMAKITFWYLTAPFFLLVAWFRIKEREV